MADLTITRTEYSQANKTVTVEGITGSSSTVMVLLNPNLSGNPTDDYIRAHFDNFPALDRKSKANAGTFSLALNAGNNPGPFQVKVLTAGGKGELIPVPFANPLTPGGGPGGGTPGGTTTLPGGS